MSDAGSDDRVPDPDPARSQVPTEPPPPIMVIASPAPVIGTKEFAVERDSSAGADSRPETSSEIPVDRWAHRRAEPRPLALLWTIFLALSTMICLASLAARGATSYESYRPAARSLLTIVAIGLTVLWPMVRLSQSPARSAVAAWVWKDLVVLLVPAQAVIWPQSFPFLAKWPAEVVACVAAMLSAWAILTGAFLAWASTLIRRETFGGPRRAWLMLISLGMISAGPLLGWPFHASGRVGDSSGTFDGWRAASPLTAVFEFTRDRFWTGEPARVVREHWWAVGIVAFSALLAWIAYGFWSHSRSDRHSPSLAATDSQPVPSTYI